MPILLNHFEKIKNNYCIAFVGQDVSTLILLKILKKSIINSYPDVNLYIACNDFYLSLFENENNIINVKQIDKTFFSLINLLHTTIELENFVIESKINILPIKTNFTQNKNCVFLPGSELNSYQISKFIDFIKLQNYTCEINKPWQNAGWVIGNDYKSIYQSAAAGIPTTLLTKEKNILFEKLFPDCDIIELSFFDA